MVELQASPTELSTAATDLLLGAGCALAAWRIARGRNSPRRTTWCAVFALLAGASFLGGVVHGVRLPEGAANLLWHPLYLALGIAAALVLVAALHDALGEARARRWRAPLLATGVVAYFVTQAFDGAFAVFILYEALVTIAALALYTWLAVAGTLPGALLLVCGLLLNLAAAGIQGSDLGLELVFRFDHNGLFHLALMPAFALLYLGASRGLGVAAPRRPEA